MISHRCTVKQHLDFSELLDVIKYEPPMKVRGADAAGDFHSGFEKLIKSASITFMTSWKPITNMMNLLLH